MATGSQYRPTQHNRSPNSFKKNAILIMPIIASIGLVWLLLLKLEQLPTSLTFNQSFETHLSIWLVIFVLVIIILTLSISIGDVTPQVQLEEELSTKSKVKSKSPKPKQSKPSSTITVEPYEKPVEFVPLSNVEANTSAEKPETASTLSGTAKSDQAIVKPASEPRKAEKGSDDAVAAPPLASKDKVKPSIYEYPLEAEGGLYGDTFVELEKDVVLKLRTMVVKDIYLM